MVMAAIAPRQGLDGAKKNLLFIDDDPIVVASLKLLFGREFNTFNAATAEEGIELFEKHRPDVILLDLRLPGKDGLDILREIREQDSVTPIIIMTGYATLATAEESIRLGAADYVHKPFDAIYLKNRIVELASLPDARPSPRDNINTLASSLQRLNELELAENASSSFLHDVASPLTGLISMTEMLREASAKNSELSLEKFSETLESISDNARYMAALVEHWRAFSEPQTLTCETIFLSDVIVVALGLVKGRAADRKVKVEFDEASENALLNINRFALARVLANLLQNAIDAVASGTGIVELSTQTTGKTIEIIVRDNGPGISPIFIDQVFEPRTTTKSKSMGLGLYISKKIIQSNGGGISVCNIPGSGAEFTVSLEIADHDNSIGSR